MKLVIAEKPSVAKNIAAVIGASENKHQYMEGNGWLVSWCVGHLVDLSAPEAYDETFKKWDIDALPIIPEKYLHSIKAESAGQYKVVKELMNREDVESVVCATDAGREGELIFRRVYYKAGCRKPIKRLWISSLEKATIAEGMSSLKDGAEYDNLYHAAMCRAKADWVIGINMTRLMTKAYNSSVLNVGRVFSPTLAMICDREQKIASFVKQKFYRVHLKTAQFDAVSERIDEENAAKAVAAACSGQTAAVKEITREKKTENPPLLYDLTSLQGDANSLFGFTAKQTLDLLQSLYEAVLVTYPRTDAKYLTNDMTETAKEVISAVYSVPGDYFPAYQKTGEPDIGRILDSSKVTDHHAIIPTAQIKNPENLKKLSKEQMKLLALISCRLLCATGAKHIYDSSKAVLVCAGTEFSLSGKMITEMGWKVHEEAMKVFFKTENGEAEKGAEKENDKALPELAENQTITGAAFDLSEHFTAPPKRYTEKTLLHAMECAGNEEMDDDVERKGLGTSATRAEMIEKLISSGFAVREKKNLVPTQKGMNLISVLPEKLISVELTVEWENRLSLIAKGEDTEEAFMSDLEEFLRHMVSEYRNPIPGKENLFPREGKEEAGKCPCCGASVFQGKNGFYCDAKCGLNLGRVYAFGKELSAQQIKSVLSGKKVLLKDLTSKVKGTTYDAYAVPDGVEDYTYQNKEGREVSAKRLKFKMEFPKPKKDPKGGRKA